MKLKRKFYLFISVFGKIESAKSQNFVQPRPLSAFLIKAFLSHTKARCWKIKFKCLRWDNGGTAAEIYSLPKNSLFLDAQNVTSLLYQEKVIKL
jgi:hypothetical protein